MRTPTKLPFLSQRVFLHGPNYTHFWLEREGLTLSNGHLSSIFDVVLRAKPTCHKGDEVWGEATVYAAAVDISCYENCDIQLSRFMANSRRTIS